MRKKLSKGTKSIMAVAIATVLAIPAVTATTSPKVAADDEVYVPEPIAVYDFSDDENITYSALSIEKDNKAEIVEDEKYGKVVKLKDALPVEATQYAAKAVTMTAADYDKDPTIGKLNEDPTLKLPEGVVSVFKVEKDELNSYNVNSSIQIENPFAGMTELVEEPIGYNEESSYPIWETGVTVSYWMKSNGKATEEDAESPLLSFNREKESVHKDDRDKYNLAQMYYADKTNPLFSIGTSEKLTLDAFKAKYPDISTGSWSTGTRTVLTDYGVFACMNYDEYPLEDVFYIDKKTNTLERANCSWVDLSKFREMGTEGSQMRYGIEKGCMTFFSSGGYAFTESGLVNPVYKGKTEYKTELVSERQFQRNTLHAYTYILDGDKKNYVPYDSDDNLDGDTLIDVEEWHFITYVIKNDSISLYVDGVVQDDTMFTNTTNGPTLIVGDSFNKGWGYHNSASRAKLPDIETNGKEIFTQNEGYLFGGINAKNNPENIIYDEDGNKLIGYNGNCNADSLMEYLTSQETQLFIGEDGPSAAADLMDCEFGSKADTCIGTISFYDEPLNSDDVVAIYEDALKKLGGGTTIPTPTPTDSGTGTSTPTPTGTASGSATEVPTPTASGSATDVPTPTSGVTVLGDVDLNGKVEMNDVNLVLKAALKLNPLDGQGLINADADKNGKIEMNDVTLILKAALKLIDLK